MPPPLALAVLPPSLLLLLLAVAVLLATLAPPVQAATSAALFCKCTCLTNSTIIRLQHTESCNDCTRQFCLNYHLPICKSTKEEEVVTTCFQRDSVKDQIAVCIFIAATVGLLLWALVKPWLARRRAGYAAVPG